MGMSLPREGEETLIASSAPRNERIRFRERIPNTYC
jgi:hypothetical protein